MKVFPAELDAHYAQAVTTLTQILKLTRKDGQVFGFTSFNRDLDYDDGAGLVTYRAASGADASAFESSAGFRPDAFEVGWLLDDATITLQDLAAGRWDRTDYVLYEVNYKDLASGRHWIVERGRIGDVSIEGGAALAKCRPLMEAYLAQVGRTIGPKCVAPFGDAELCGVDLEPPPWSASTAVTPAHPRDQKVGSLVRPTSFNDRFFECSGGGTTGSTEPAWDLTIGNTTADGSALWTTRRALLVEATVDVVTDERVFTLSYTGDAPDDLLARGRVAFTGGANAGEVMDIKTWELATRTVTLALPMPYPVASGDPVRLTAGCLKRRGDCKAFRNIENHRGFPDVPGNDARMQILRAR